VKMTRGNGTPVYPDFVGIGAQKAGTTWLQRNLQAHPDIWMPEIKELHYFDEKISDSPNPFSRLYKRLSSERAVDLRWRRQLRTRIKRHLNGSSREGALWTAKYYFGRPDDGWYASLFEPGKGKVVGEITPEYSILERDAISHVHSLAPEAKILLMIRNPIERAWSQAVMGFDKSGRDIAAAGDEVLRRTFDREGLRLRSDYLKTLENWSSFYAEGQIFVGFLEDVHFFPEELLDRLYGFLGVDPSFRPRRVTRKVHTRSAGTMPTRAAAHLAGIYREEIEALAECFGGYASFWLHGAERLAEEPPAEERLPYPLYESQIWKEWTDGTGAARFHSGPLASARAG